MPNWIERTKETARDGIREYQDAIVEQLIRNDEASNDLLNDYDNGDSWHHENGVDREYDLKEAADLLETDRGLWEGQEPRKAISTQAAFTYGNAVHHFWHEFIKEINARWTQVREEVGSHPEFDALLEAASEDEEAIAGLEDWLRDKGHTAPNDIVNDVLNE
jgi:hypothetical protein